MIKKNNKILFGVILFFILIVDVNAITGSGTLSSNSKSALFPIDDKYCTNDESEYPYSFYYGGGVFLRDSTAATTEEKEEDYKESTDVYESLNLAKSACADFTKESENKDEGYLCKSYPPKTAYSCTGTIDAISGTSNAYLEKYITGGVMFSTEMDCLSNCLGNCSLSNGYAYKYVKPTTVENDNGSIEVIGGRVFQTEEGLSAFCVQPSKGFQCPYYYIGSGELIPQYCANDQLDLSTCKDDYTEDYRCGLAYIALKATGGGDSWEDAENRGTLIGDSYGAADMAMRMWASDKGHLAGMNSVSYPVSGENKTTNINFYGITATRVEEDANYLEYGVTCSKSSKNNGVMCDYKDYILYKEALTLYNEALHVNEADVTPEKKAGDDKILDNIVSSANRVPKLVSTTLGATNNTVQTTNPTAKECKAGETDCQVTLQLFDSSGNVIPSDSSYCDKNFCYAKYTTKNLCEEIKNEVAKIKITITNFEINSGAITEYHHCTDPTNNQIMFAIEATGTETTDSIYINTYSSKLACECADDSSSLKSTTDSKKYCNNYKTANTSSDDYNGVEEGYISDPPMSQILNSCSGEKYFREESYETAGDTCKIYCRKETHFYLANKEKVYSGMQFRYELEEKKPNNLNSGQHLTSIVLQQRQCVSEIDYDGWKKNYESAVKAVAEAWNDWQKWEVLKYNQEKYEYYPRQISRSGYCTANCIGFIEEKAKANYEDGSAELAEALRNNHSADGINSCILRRGDLPDAGQVAEPGTTAYATCDKINGIVRKFDDVLIHSTTSNGDFGILGARDSESGEGICLPLCSTSFEWLARDYNNFDYSSGSSSAVPSEHKEVATKSSSGFECTIGAYTVWSGTKYTKNKSKINVNESNVFTYERRGYNCVEKSRNSSTYECTYEYTIPSPIEKTKSDKDLLTKSKLKLSSVPLNEYDKLIESLNDKFKTTYPTSHDNNPYYDINSGRINYYNASTTGDTCEDPKDGDYAHVYDEAEKARLIYNAAQKEVQLLLTKIQQCNMYGSGLGGESDPDIKYYTLTKTPYVPGSGGGGGGGDNSSSTSPAIGGGGNGNKVGSGAFIIDESVTNVKNVSSKIDTTDDTGETVYNSFSMESDTTQDYTVMEVATTNNKASIKRKLLTDASCVGDTCADLLVEYEDSEYGEATTYKKVTGIVKTDDLYNVYCEGSKDECFRVASTTEDEEDGWLTVPSTETNKNIARRIVCNIINPDPSDPSHKCEFKYTEIPDNNYVSFKVTTEVDFYRPKNYYVKAFTGEVTESKSTSMLKTQNYTSLGNNIYPVSNDPINAKSGTHSINYTFTNLGISKFGEEDDVNLNQYEYECAYEVYNNTTGYNCEVSYDENGDPIPSDCSNFCFYVEDSIPDLECIQWGNMGESSGYGFIFRNVDLSNLFPSGRNYGTNWSNATKIIEEIQTTSKDIFLDDSHVELSVTLTPDTIKKIREYNRIKNVNSGGYQDNSLIQCTLELSLDGNNNRFSNCRSTFIDEIQSGSGAMGVITNKIVRRGSDKE